MLAPFKLHEELVDEVCFGCVLFAVSHWLSTRRRLRKVMRCDDDGEMLCDRDAGCGETCHYYVYESCYEVCK